MEEKKERRRLTLGQFLSEVNLRDFGGMVRSELHMIGSTLKIASESPRAVPLGILVALLRSVLLAVVIVVFGAGILLITAIRALVRLATQRAGAG